MQDMRIVLEGLNGPHNLQLGDYYLDEENEIIYVGVGLFKEADDECIIPVGTIYINSNGEYNVKTFEQAVVNVAPYGVGEIAIDRNGTYNVSGIKKALVDVPQDLHTVPFNIDIEVRGPVKLLIDFMLNADINGDFSFGMLPIFRRALNVSAAVGMDISVIKA